MYKLSCMHTHILLEILDRIASFSKPNVPLDIV